MSTLITYHESLAPITEKVIQKFYDAWWRVGYQPLVVTPYTDYPEGIPQLNAFLKKVVKYPTVNAKDYELLCYYRWLHIHRTMLANSIESAWILDYDVLPNKKHEFFLESPLLDNQQLLNALLDSQYYSLGDVVFFLLYTFHFLR